jgi:hypothetical protein
VAQVAAKGFNRTVKFVSLGNQQGKNIGHSILLRRAYSGWKSRASSYSHSNLPVGGPDSEKGSDPSRYRIRRESLRDVNGNAYFTSGIPVIGVYRNGGRGLCGMQSEGLLC